VVSSSRGLQWMRLVVQTPVRGILHGNKRLELQPELAKGRYWIQRKQRRQETNGTSTSRYRRDDRRLLCACTSPRWEWEKKRNTFVDSDESLCVQYILDSHSPAQRYKPREFNNYIRVTISTWKSPNHVRLRANQILKH
jgi:hypothetical protein